MDGILEFAIVAFASLFTMMNPLGIIPIYITLTGDLEPREAKKTAYKAVLTGLLTLILFAVAGKFIFDFFAILSTVRKISATNSGSFESKTLLMYDSTRFL